MDKTFVNACDDRHYSDKKASFETTLPNYPASAFTWEVEQVRGTDGLFYVRVSLGSVSSTTYELTFKEEIHATEAWRKLCVCHVLDQPFPPDDSIVGLAAPAWHAE